MTIMYMMILLSLLLSRCWWFWFYKLAYLKEINHENRFCLLPFFCCFILADVIWQWSFILCRVCLNSRLADQSVGRSTRLVSSWSAFAHVGYHKIIDCKWMRMRKTFTNTHLLSLEDICNKANFFILFFIKYKKGESFSRRSLSSSFMIQIHSSSSLVNAACLLFLCISLHIILPWIFTRYNFINIQYPYIYLVHIISI